MAALPSGIVTFLFTDIEGSTRLFATWPESYRAVLARHNSLVEGAIAGRGGIVFRRAGDSYCAAFTSPTAAVLAALGAQRALRRESWDQLGAMLVRMGITTGEVEHQDDQYFGLALHRCARLTDSAHGGQVVISAATAALVADTLPEGALLTDLGEHRLRDLDRPERVFQLTVADLPADFPPLRTLTAIPNNLPAQATELVGREQLLRATRTALLRPSTRLVTLTGSGGAGKTRLAIELAAQLLDSFVDGVRFVPLASVTDPEQVLPAIARVIDVREAADRPVIASLTDALRQQQLLLVLDNFEHVTGAAAGIATLLSTAHSVKVLVTSRAPLRLYGERTVTVPPLTLPDRRDSPTSAHLVQFEAVRLFVDRAQEARSDFALSDENAGDVAEICHRLDGLPLALELAAARIRSMPPRTMIQRMERRLPLLIGGARDRPARQRTLRDTITWSYDLLEPAEQAMFRRLAVFRGFSLEAAETVCGDDGRSGEASVATAPLGMDVLDTIESLVEKSLLRQDEGIDGQPWYVMLETVREFALERLDESGEDGPIRCRQAKAAIDLAGHAASMLVGPEQARWFGRLEQEHDNLRVALRWSREHGCVVPALRLGAVLGALWLVRGYLREGREQLTEVLTLAGTADHPALRADVLGKLGWILLDLGDNRAASAVLDEALSIQRRLGDERALAETLESLGWSASAEEDYATAHACFAESLNIARRLDNRRSISHALNGLGWIATAQGHHAKACALLDEALAGFRALADERGIADCLGHLGWALKARGETREARCLLRESLGIAWDLRDRTLFAVALDKCATLLLAEDDARGAACLLAAAEAQREIVGVRLSPSVLAEVETGLASIRARLGDQAFAEAWAHGSAMSPEQAIAYASDEREAETSAPSSIDETATSARDAASPLTHREQEVAVLISQGLTNRQIAERLVITEGTAANHVYHILAKLELKSRAQVAAWAVEHRLIS
ncbi:MAG: tetratricopeptide repeat protein [Chloroflexi bacterium]|nr:tetratricopeptide repeat protein [Chloroflexota bacterium]